MGIGDLGILETASLLEVLEVSQIEGERFCTHDGFGGRTISVERVEQTSRTTVVTQLYYKTPTDVPGLENSDIIFFSIPQLSRDSLLTFLYYNGLDRLTRDKNYEKRLVLSLLT